MSGNDKTYMISFVDIDGVLRAKLVPGNHLQDVRAQGAGFAGFAVRGMGQGPHDPDMSVIPDLETVEGFAVPGNPNILWTIGNLRVENEPWPYCTRSLLADRLRDLERDYGMEVKVGIEPEFYLARQNSDGTVGLADEVDKSDKTCYQQSVLGRHMEFLLEILDVAQHAGIDVYQIDHEDGLSQFEVNWTFDNALLTVDRYTFLRYAIKQIAEKNHLVATFMPKPFANLTGNGAHVHLSVWQDGRNLFLDTRDPHGLSLFAYQFMAGIVAHAPSLTALVAPTVNSYKRLRGRITQSGATWSPSTATVGSNNRTHMIRIPAPGRFEFRAMDGSANPYLAVAALIAAGMDGVHSGAHPPDVHTDNMFLLSSEDIRARGIVQLPDNLLSAIDALSNDVWICEAMGRPLINEFTQLKYAEWASFHRQVTTMEIQSYLKG